MSSPGDLHGHDLHSHDLDSRTVRDSLIAPASVDLADAVVQGVRAGFGLLSLGLEVALRALGDSAPAVPRQPGPRMPVSDVADLVVGTAWGLARLSGRLAATGARIAEPVLGVALRPPLVPRGLQPAHAVQQMTERWQRDRPETLRTLGRWSASALPGVVDAVLDRVDVEQVATVLLDRVDLTRIASTLLDRLDVNEVADKLLSRLDVDEVSARLLNQLDVDEVSAQVLSQLDLTQLVVDRVDLQRVVAVALDRLDLTAIVVDQVDLGSVVSAALRQVDLTQIVLKQVDLIGVAEYVVEGIDLSGIIRDSTGSVASEAVVGLRMQGVDADAVVGRVVDRMLHRGRERRTAVASEELDSPSLPTDPPTETRA